MAGRFQNQRFQNRPFHNRPFQNRPLGSAKVPRPNEVNVLVTGFGSFGINAAAGASSRIASSLPAFLPITPAHPTAIRISQHQQLVMPSYAEINKFTHQVHDPRVHYDLIMHIGVFQDMFHVNEYTFETIASRDVYAIRDMTGWLPEETEQPIFFQTSPAEVRTAARVPDVSARWASEVQNGINVRVSDDAGGSLAEYLYYSTLAHYAHVRNNNLPWYERTTVAMMQATRATDTAAIERGCNAVTSLIYSLVDSRRMHGAYDQDSGAGMITVDGQV